MSASTFNRGLDLWVQHERRNYKHTQSWACVYCIDKTFFVSTNALWDHALQEHQDRIPTDDLERLRFKTQYQETSAKKRPTPDEPPLPPRRSRGRVLLPSLELTPECSSPTPNEPPPPPRRSRVLPPSLTKPSPQIEPGKATSRRNRPSNRRKVLRVKIKDVEHLACPDSGSEENIMSENFATSNDLLIRRRPQDKKRFELGNGKHVWSTGRVRVPVELRKALTRKKRWFYILSSCPVPLIFGMPFLKETEILSKNRHLLEECPTEMRNISSLLWIGSPRQQMSCSLDGHILTATADTGSDLNLISLKCAKREGFSIDRRREARRRIQVGDGSETETIGQVHIHNLTLDWRKSETPILDLDVGIDDSQTSNSEEGNPRNSDADTKSSGVIFHVLPNLPCDIIFGRSLLEQTDAFNLCPSLSSSSPSPPQDDAEARAFQVLISLGPVSLRIPLSRRKRRTSTSQVNSKEQHDDERHAEMFRRSTREDEISDLPIAEKGISRAREARKAREWDSQHASCIHCTPV